MLASYSKRQEEIKTDTTTKEVVQYTYGEGANVFAVTLSNPKKQSISGFFNTFSSLDNYESIKFNDTIDEQIRWTKVTVAFFKEFLSELKNGYEPKSKSVSADVTVAVYVDVLVAFAYLRHSMTVFILLQKEKILNLEKASGLKGATDAETIQKLTAQITALESQLATARAQVGANVTAINELQGQLATARASLTSLTGQLDAQQQLAAESQAALADVRASVALLTSQAATLTAQVRNAQANAAAAKGALAAKTSELTTAKELLQAFADALNTTVTACSAGTACPKITFTSKEQVDAIHQKITKYIYDLEQRIQSLGELIGIGVPIIAQIPAQATAL